MSALILLALALPLQADDIDASFRQERARQARAAVGEFYMCLLSEDDSADCRGLLVEPDKLAKYIPLATRAQHAFEDPSRALWAHLRSHRGALANAGEGRSITFIRTDLEAVTALDVLTVEVVSGAREPAQTSGVVRLVRIALVWSSDRDRYCVEPLSVNGIDIFPVGGEMRPPSDIPWLLGLVEQRPAHR